MPWHGVSYSSIPVHDHMCLNHANVNELTRQEGRQRQQGQAQDVPLLEINDDRDDWWMLDVESP